MATNRGSTGRRLPALALAVALLACSGDIEPGPDRSGAYVPAGSEPGGRGGSGAPVGNQPGDPRIAQRIWRLTPRQFNDEVERLFGAGAPEVSIPESAAEYGITNIAENGVVNRGNASVFADGARAIANWVVAQRNTATRCTDFGSDACVDGFLDWCPASAFRREVSDGEKAELRALFDALRAGYDYDYAFAGIVRALLLSPDFLYRTELGDGGAVLAPDEIADLLAFAITDQSPDAELLQAAEEDDLADPDVREAQARRLMAKSERSWQRFFWEWLDLHTLHSQGEEVGLSDALVAQMEEEYRAYVRGIVIAEHGSLRDLLSATHTWAQPQLAEHYGARHPGSGLQRIELDPAERGGLLTLGAWLVSHGKRGRDNVVRRGMNIYKHAMCNNDLSPPAGVDVQAELAKLVPANATVRQTVDARGAAPACGGCHRVADPVGLVFERFASDGTFRTAYPDGRPVDSAGDVAGIGAFDDARALSSALADDVNFQRCFVRRFLHFVVGIDLGSPLEVAWSQQAHERLLETDTSLEELLVAIVRHPAFVERRLEAGP